MEILGASCGKFESKLWKFWEQLVEIAYAAGEKIEYNKLSFTFVRRKNGFRALLNGFLRFQSATKEILPYKKSAAGENFAVSERY